MCGYQELNKGSKQIMAKADIRAELLLKWDEYRDKPYDQVLPSIYSKASLDAKLYSGWYWASIRTKRRASLTVRFLTLIFIILGTLLPIVSGIIDKSDYFKLVLTQLGVVSLALGGLLQVGDRVFGWSSGWLRYISTVMAMENLTREFELDWAGYIINKNGNLGNEDAKSLFNLAEKFQQGLINLQNEETESWKMEFSTGAALLGDLIKSQKELNEKASDAVRIAQKTTEESVEKEKQLGAIQVGLDHNAEVKITFDNDEPIKFMGLKWSRMEVKPGLHQITVTMADNKVISNVVDVKAGMIATLEITLPQ